MKKLIGFLIAFFSIAFIILIILKVWNVAFIGWADVLRSGVTLALLASIVVILLVVNLLFLKEIQPKNKYKTSHVIVKNYNSFYRFYP